MKGGGGWRQDERRRGAEQGFVRRDGEEMEGSAAAGSGEGGSNLTLLARAARGALLNFLFLKHILLRQGEL
jgi:hypothetical protein